VGRTALHEFLKKYGLDRESLDESTSSEPPHPATDESTLLEVLQEPPTPGLPVPQVPDEFFWPHTIRRCLLVAPGSPPLVGHRSAMLLR
jgi:hypothetical protein